MNCPGLYILDEQGEPLAEPDLLKWAEWYGTANRRLGDDQCGPYRVSTVFLGVDHEFIGGPLFETKVFGEAKDPIEEMERYSTRAEALAGHAQMCSRMLKRPSRSSRIRITRTAPE